MQDTHRALLFAVVDSSIPFSFVDNPFVRDLLMRIPGYKPPTRYKLTMDILATEHARALLSVMENMHRRNDLTLSLDGWEDMLRRPLYAFMVLHGKFEPELLDLVDVSIIKIFFNTCLTRKKLIIFSAFKYPTHRRKLTCKDQGSSGIY